LATIQIDNHLLLRNYEIDDFQQLFDAINNSRSHLNPWLGWVAKTTRAEHSYEFIQLSQERLHAQEALTLGVFYNGEIIGGVGMHDWDHATRRAQIGYWICKGYEGQGIVTRSLRGFIGYLFGQVGLHKIEIHYVTANKRSAKVAEGLGFTLEGVIRQSTMRNGMIEDIAITGLLRQEWEKDNK
jgi:ribosomal-protein-serine acetyltransferase